MKKLINNFNNIYSIGNNDECYTPKYAVEPILKYLPKDKIIWCPFDRNDSNFVKLLKSNGFNVVNTHIDYGQDFYEYEPKEWDIIVSNPPFTNKRKIFERCLKFNKPFALIMTLTWLNDTAPKELFLNANKDLQLLMFDKRIFFLNNGIVQDKIPFASAYFCCDLLPKQIIIEPIDNTRY